MNEEFSFTEKQKFSQWWLWTILVGINVVFLFGLIKKLIFLHDFGNNLLSNTGLAFLCLGFMAFTFLFYKMGLYTKIDKQGIYFRFIPFHTAFRFYPWEKITSMQITEYNAFKEYGGWGIRGGRKRIAYTVSGNTGIDIELVNDKKILIGTRKPEEVKKIMKKLCPASFSGG